MTQIACGMSGFRRGLAAGLMAAGLLAIASPSAAQLGPPPPPRAASAKPGDQKVLLNWKVPLPEHYADWDGPTVRHYEYRVRPEGGVFPSTWTRIPEYTGRVGGGLDERYAVEKLANGTPLSNGTSYFFEMRSENARGEGEATDEFSSTPVANTPATFEMTDETFTSGPSGIIVPRVPAVLLANLVGDIDDAEGIQIATGLDDRYTWQWQWIRVKDGVETEIPHATATGAPAGGYTLTPADVGSEIKARMRFRDDAYNQEEWVSPPTPTILPAALCRAPNLEGGRTLLGSDQIRLVQLDQEGQSQLRVGSAQGSFTLGGYGFSAVYHAIEGPEAGQLVLKLESQVNDTDQRQLALHVCEEVYPLYGDEIQINRSPPFTPRDNFRWPNSTAWSDLVTRTIHLSRDTAPPRLASVVFSEPPRNDFSPSLFIAFDEKLGDPDPVVADFTVEVDGSAVELNGGEFRTAPEGIRLTLAEPLPAAYSSLTVAYTQAAGHFVIQDPPGNRTPDFKVSVPYRRTPPPPPPTNAPPLAVDDAAQTAEDTLVTIAVLTNDSDPDGDTLTVAGVSEPAHGTAVLTETGAVRYTPESNFNGTDRFTYVVGDGSGLTAQAAVDVTVLPVNDPPEAVDDAAETAEDTPVNIAVLDNDSDPDGDPLTVAEVSAPAHGTAVLTETGAVRYTPEPNFNGTDRFTYVVGDGSGLTAQAAVDVTVLPVNDPPEAVDDAAETAEDTPVTIAVLDNDSDPDGDPLTVAEVSAPAHGTAVLTEAGTVQYAPEPDYHGPDRFTYVVSSGSGLTAQAAVDVTVRPVDDPPEAVDDAAQTAEDTLVTIAVLANDSDPDGDTLTVAGVSEPAHGTAVLTETGAVRYTPEPNFNGTDRFTYVVGDGSGLTAQAAVDVTVLPVNDPPEAVDDAAETAEDTLVTIAVLANDSDPDGDTLTVAEVSEPAHGTAVLTETGAVRYTPEPNFNGTDRFTYVVGDGSGLTAQAAVDVTVLPVNDPPEAVDDAAETAEDTPVNIAVLDNDSDPDGDPLTVAEVSAPAHGTAVLTEAGTVQYAPEPDYHGPDRFTYVVSSGSGLTAQAAVDVTVRPANDPPEVLGVIPDQTLEAGDGPASLDLSPYFEDRDGDSLGYTAVASDAVALSLAGATLTLTVARPGAATVTVTAQDPGGLTAAQAFLVTTSDRQARGVLEDTLAAMGRGHLASARATLGRRAAATGREESRITVAGMHVPLGTDDAAAAGRALAERWITGLAGWMPPPGAGWPGMGPGGLGAFGLAGPGLGGAGGAPVGAAGPGRRGAGTSSAFSGLSPFAGRGQTEFQLALGEEAGDGSEPGRRWTVWGQLDVQAFQGGRSPASRYDGALRTAYVGVDARLGERWLVGVAVTRSNADGDWSFGSSTGRLTTQLTSLQPYLRWSDGGTSIWATAGGGRGSAENERTRYGLQEESGLGLRMGLVEVRRRLATVGPGVELALRGDVSWARLATAEGGELIDALEADVHQLRVGIDVSRLLRTAGGTSVEPFGEVHARHDGGSGQTGAGLEVAGGLRVARGVFRVEGMGRLLGLHAAESYREHGAAVTLSVGEGARRPGLTLSLSPRWGAPATASDALWRDQLFHQQTPGGPVAGRDEGALDTRVDYGLQLPSGGLLTPFGLYGRSPYGQRLQAGLLLDRLGPLGLEVSGERHALPQQGRDEYRMTVLGSITFGGPDGAPARRSGAP